MDYDEFKLRITNVINKVCPGAFPDDKCTVGTHTLRKTGYLFAVWGILYTYERQGRRPWSRWNGGAERLPIQPLEDDALAKAARHKDMNSAKVYYQDAVSRYDDVTKPAVWAAECVSQWKAIFVATQAANYSSSLSTRTEKTLAELVPWYVQAELKLNTTEFDFYSAISHSCNLKTPQTLNEELMSFFYAHVPAQFLSHGMDLLHRNNVALLRSAGRAPPPPPPPPSSGKSKRTA